MQYEKHMWGGAHGAGPWDTKRCAVQIVQSSPTERTRKQDQRRIHAFHRRLNLNLCCVYVFTDVSQQPRW